MRRHHRLPIDIAMYLCFLYLMNYHLGQGLLLHGILGILLIALFFWHNVLNRRWYKSLVRGRKHGVALALCVTNLPLVVACLGATVSSVLLSGDVFSFSPLVGSASARTFHATSTAVGFILVMIHTGWHVAPHLDKLQLKVDASIFRHAYRLIDALVLLLGLYLLATSPLLARFLPSGLPSHAPSYLTYLLITLAICQLTQLASKQMRRRRTSI
ncbi:MAG: hypothetical protein Q4C56_03175 [Peptococcaceae bacterium]|nr:hypothetical protein [Peptococcaceae bacterium]